MSSADNDAEKPHDPTQKRLDDARRKGEIPRSTDLTTAASYAGILLSMLMLGGQSVRAMGDLMAGMIARADSASEQLLRLDGQGLAGGLILKVALAAAPFFVAPAMLVLVALIVQQGFTFSTEKLQPKLSRISPLSNLKNKFGRGGLFEFAKSFTKLSIYSAVLAWFLHRYLPELSVAVQLDAGPTVSLLGRTVTSFLSVVLVIAVGLGVIDVLWQRAEHIRRNRMSRKEIMDEHKQSEGDPTMKQQRRQRAYDIATNRMMQDVPDADVIIVNPTHYAVALKWSRAGGSAPVCVAKGLDEVAARIRETGLAANVPIHRDAPTARALHATVEIGDEIAVEHYAAVAAAIRFADQMRARKRAGV
ncbi:flagellar type III secretion system protein FlhB [Qingshengfaniella alkalisoli]|uniref:Flagellar biosynthesis protein FlhB n=1 Tax=Qingshengfaniella alkalisoli TaxID=2599296 RepID=A0A5B8IZV6_9RHOB|nr:flagellar type III secretion system protein FlhB [Qingshengfaniella alkalisoli]QDY70148.1 flagellar biosynthesis protein FlhB [Qingshengfaniella alkalisoli]